MRILKFLIADSAQMASFGYWTDRERKNYYVICNMQELVKLT